MPKLDKQGNLCYNTVKYQQSTNNTDKQAKLIWAKKILGDLVDKNFYGNVQLNFQDGVIINLHKTEVLKT